MFSVYGYSASLSDIISAVESLDQFNSFTSFYYFPQMKSQRTTLQQSPTERPVYLYISGYNLFILLFIFQWFSNWRLCLLSSPLKCLDVFWMLHQDQGWSSFTVKTCLALFRPQKYVLFYIYWFIILISVTMAQDAGIGSSIRGLENG